MPQQFWLENGVTEAKKKRHYTGNAAHMCENANTLIRVCLIPGQSAFEHSFVSILQNPGMTLTLNLSCHKQHPAAYRDLFRITIDNLRGESRTLGCFDNTDSKRGFKSEIFSGHTNYGMGYDLAFRIEPNDTEF